MGWPSDAALARLGHIGAEMSASSTSREQLRSALLQAAVRLHWYGTNAEARRLLQDAARRDCGRVAPFVAELSKRTPFLDALTDLRSQADTRRTDSHRITLDELELARNDASGLFDRFLLPYDRDFWGGLCAQLALRQDDPLRGALILCGWLPLSLDFELQFLPVHVFGKVGDTEPVERPKKVTATWFSLNPAHSESDRRVWLRERVLPALDEFLKGLPEQSPYPIAVVRVLAEVSRGLAPNRVPCAECEVRLDLWDSRAGQKRQARSVFKDVAPYILRLVDELLPGPTAGHAVGGPRPRKGKLVDPWAAYVFEGGGKPDADTSSPFGKQWQEAFHGRRCARPGNP